MAPKFSPAADDDDWVEITPRSTYKPNFPDSDAVVRLSLWMGKAQNRVSICFRGPLLEWLSTNGPTFRIELGGDAANKFRITADPEGRYRCLEMKRHGRLVMNNLTAWPLEHRPMPATAEATVNGKVLVLVLPEDFAKPIPKVPEKAASPPIKGAPAVLPPQARSGYVVQEPGHPPPGRSALDQRRAAGK